MVFGRRDTPPPANLPGELPVPGAAYGNDTAVEMLRAWSIDKGLQVSLARNFDDPAVWGLLISDIARHAARVYAAETEYSEDEALKRIVDLFNAEMTNPTDLGNTGHARQ
jgi:hypothetical protein